MKSSTLTKRIKQTIIWEQGLLKKGYNNGCVLFKKSFYISILVFVFMQTCCLIIKPATNDDVEYKN